MNNAPVAGPDPVERGRDATTDPLAPESATNATLAVAAAGPLLVLVAFTVPLTTLTATAQGLGAGPGAQAWIMSAIAVGAATGLLSAGAIGDDYGRRRAFAVGALLLGAASAGAAIAPTTGFLIGARLLQGLGGAAILACGLGLIGHVFPAGAARARATGVWAAAIGAGVAIGPIMSAGLADLGGWRLPYAATAVASVVLAVAGRAVLPESQATKPRRIDLPGTLLIGSGLAALLSGLVEVRSGIDDGSAVILLLGGLALLCGFVVVEGRSHDPMLDLRLFRNPDFVGATVGAFAAGAGILSLASFVPTLLERAMGVDTLVGAACLVAWSGTSVLTASGVRWLPAKLTPRVLLVLGLVGAAIGQLGMFGLATDSSVFRLLPALLLAGLAYGILNAALGRQAVGSVPSGRTAMGSGANNTARFLGSSIGLTVVTLLVTGAGGPSDPSALLAGWDAAVLLTAGVSLSGALVVGLAGGRGEGGRSGIPKLTDG